MQVKIIGVTGGSGSGKSTVVRKISEVCSDFAFIPQDNYYKTATFVNNDNITAFNWDHPDAFDMELLQEHLKSLKEGRAIDMPTYDFVHNKRSEKTIHVEPCKLIILEGLMILHESYIRELLDLKLFIDTPADIRFTRRLQRDIADRGRTVESVIKQYIEVVRPGHLNFIEPTKEYADIIIPEGGHNEKALAVLIPFVKSISAENC
jgi:uridine kinase